MYISNQLSTAIEIHHLLIVFELIENARTNKLGGFSERLGRKYNAEVHFDHYILGNIEVILVNDDLIVPTQAIKLTIWHQSNSIRC